MQNAPYAFAKRHMRSSICCAPQAYENAGAQSSFYRFEFNDGNGEG